MTLRRMAGMGRRAGRSFIAALCLILTALSIVVSVVTAYPLLF